MPGMFIYHQENAKQIQHISSWNVVV